MRARTAADNQPRVLSVVEVARSSGLRARTIFPNAEMQRGRKTISCFRHRADCRDAIARRTIIGRRIAGVQVRQWASAAAVPYRFGPEDIEPTLPSDLIDYQADHGLERSD